MTGMDDLVAWLRAQLDDDERVAREAIEGEDDRFTTHEYEWSVVSRLDGKVKRQLIVPGAPTPRDVLAEVDAKRRILDARDKAADQARADFDHVLEGNADAMNYCVKCIALPYADRTGYREEWRP